MSTPRRHPVLSASARAARSFAGRLPAAGAHLILVARSEPNLRAVAAVIEARGGTAVLGRLVDVTYAAAPAVQDLVLSRIGSYVA